MSVSQADFDALQAQVAALTTSLDSEVTRQDNLWVVISTILVFWMHAGFSLLEAGSIRAKNVQNILFKNLLNVTLTTILWWFWGYSFAFGKGNYGGFIGGHSQAGYAGVDIPATDYANWAFQWAFAATAVTIISGGMAERANTYGYIITIVWFQLMIYPFVAHWVWSGDGWLNKNGFVDFAGSAVVHMVGGFAALVGCAFLGPRKGNKKEMLASDVPNIVLGTFILWMGWYGFNGGAASGTSLYRIVMNTTIAASVSGFFNVMFYRFYKGRFLISEFCNGILVGLVAITANCDVVYDWAAFVIGLLAVPFYFLGQFILEKTGIDDAIGAFPVHGMGGIWGIIATGFFNFNDMKGVFYMAGTGYTVIGWQFIGIIAIIAWVALMTSVLMVVLKFAGILRIEEGIEVEGMDRNFHERKLSGIPENSVVPEIVEKKD